MVKGVESFRAKLRGRAREALEAGQAASVQQGEKLATAMKFLAPREDGALIRSIQSEPITERKGKPFIGARISAGDEATTVTNGRGVKFQNARIQEFGTKSMPANPFFFVAYRANRSTIRRAISRAVSTAWRKP